MVEAQHTLVAKVEVIQERLKRAKEQMLEAGDEPAPANSTEEPEHDPTEVRVEEDAFELPTEQTLPPLNEDLFEEIGIDITSDDVAPPSSELSDTLPSEGNDASDPNTVELETMLDEEVDESEETTSDASPHEAELEETSDAAAPAASVPLTGAARVERVRQLQRDVKLHFQVRDWEHAVSLLYELVDLEPEVAKHHGMLARAMARHPVMRKDAERHFIEALRLSPQDADLHFSLGLYYKSFGMHSRAQTEFRTALRIRPQHEGALKHLSPGRGGKDPLKDMFKKIFG